MVEDSEDDALLLAIALRTAGYEPIVERVETGDALCVALDRETWDVALIDYVMPRFSPLSALEIIREKGLDLPCILVSGKVTDEIAIAAMKAGAVDFVTKDALARLPQAIERERNAAIARRAARDNEARLAAIVETAVDGIITIDERAVVESMNPAAARLLGYAPEEVIGHNVNMLMPEPYHSEHQGYVEHYLRTGEAKIIGMGRDVEAKRKDGTTFPIHLSVSEARLGGRLIFTGILHDESERKRAGEVARRLASIVEGSEEAILAMTPDGLVTDWNPGAERLYGYTAAEMVGRPVSLLMPPDAGDELQDILARVSRGESVPPHDAVRVRRDGSPVDIGISAAPIFDEAGKVAGISWVARDITGRKQATARTAALQRITTALLRASTPTEVGQVITAEAIHATGAAGGGLAVWTEDGRELENLAMAGYPPEAGAKWRHAPGDTAAPLVEAARTGRAVLLRSAEEWGALYPEIAAENRRLGYSAAASIPLVLGGQVLGAIALSYTEAREFPPEERALLDAIAGQAAQALERARLYEAEQKARAEAEEANQAKDQFVAMISHELRNPLAAITAGVGLLRQSCPAEGRSQRALEIVERNTSLQTRLINDLLDLSRLQRGKLQLQRAPVELVKVVAPVCRSFAGEAEAARLTLTCDAEADLWVHGDMDRLQQVVLNLLSNAAKFTPTPGEIRVRAEARSAKCEVPSDQAATEPPETQHATRNPSDNSAFHTSHFALLSVEDTGIGISPELLPSLFEMFQQGEIASQRAAGLGLGLALVKGIVERHGGRVWAESEGVGKGSRFLVELPLVDAPAMPRARPPGEEAGRPVRVLVVEDNADTRSMLAETLTLAGYDVRPAGSGDEALVVVREARPDIMLVDIGLPGMDGFEFLRRAREEPGIADVPAFAVTGYGSEADVRRGREVGFSGHFVKPVNLDSLKERIREYVGAPPAAG